MIQIPFVVPYNANTPVGRALTHLCMKSALHDLRGFKVRTTDGAGGRELVFDGRWSPSDGEASLLLFAESLAGRADMVLGYVLEEVDARSARAMAEAVLIAANLRATTIVEVAS